MADYPIVPVQSELISAGLNPNNPSLTSVDFANQMAQNQQQQALQEQQIAKARELTTQAQLQTGQELEANAAGANPLLENLMTPEEAVAYLNLILKEKGLNISPADIAAWQATLPPQVNREIVEAFANRFARETTRSGQPSQFTTDQDIKVPAGKSAADLGLTYDSDTMKDTALSDGTTIAHVPDDGMYQVVYDNQGNVLKFIPGGKEPTDATAKNAAKASQDAEKQWQKLDAQINTAFKTRSGGLGSLSTAIFRSVRAINTINASTNLTAQDLSNIAQDVAGIFQGGAPTTVTAQDNNYETTLSNLADWFRKQTGFLANLRGTNILEPTKQKLLEVCTDLRDSAIANLQSFTESEEPAYKEIIEADPQRWAAMQQAKLKFIESGLLIPAGANTKLNITGMNQAQTAKNPNAPAAGVPKYTVEE